MKKTFSVLFISITFFITRIFSQDINIDLGKNDKFSVLNDNSTTKGQIQIIEDSRIQALLDKHIALNSSTELIPGWRIQIYFNSSQKNAENSKAIFKEEYPDIAAYITYQRPYFIVRVGDFRKNERSKALKFLKQISYKFPNSSWLIEDMVRQPNLENTDKN